MASNSDHDRAAWDHRATILTCLLVLWLPCLGWWIGAGPSSVSKTENRLLASAPALPENLRELRALPVLAEAYFDDRIGFRDSLIRANAWLHVALLGISPSDKLIVGQEDWFFFQHPNAVAQYRGTAGFSREQLAEWKRELERRRDWLGERGIAYVFVLAPNKHSIYPEFMPARLTRADGPDPHPQLAEYLAAESTLEIVDLMPTMTAAKRRERVYHKTDTHWNDRGAYLAYREIIAAAGRALPQFPAVAKPTPVDPFERVTPGMGLTSIVGLSRYYGEVDLGYAKSNPRAAIKPEHRTTYKEREQRLLPLALGVENTSLPRAVVFRDSFANALIPYLSENFSRVVFTWNRDIDLRMIQIERPDIVIHEVVGRFLDRPPVDFSQLERRATRHRGEAIESRGQRRE